MRECSARTLVSMMGHGVAPVDAECRSYVGNADAIGSSGLTPYKLAPVTQLHVDDRLPPDLAALVS